MNTATLQTARNRYRDVQYAVAALVETEEEHEAATLMANGGPLWIWCVAAIRSYAAGRPIEVALAEWLDHLACVLHADVYELARLESVDIPLAGMCALSALRSAE